MSEGKSDDPWEFLSELFGFVSPELGKRIISGIAIGVIALAMTAWSVTTFAVLM